jgi:hypothetical protein
MFGLKLFRAITRAHEFGQNDMQNQTIGENGGVFQMMVSPLDICIS